MLDFFLVLICLKWIKFSHDDFPHTYTHTYIETYASEKNLDKINNNCFILFVNFYCSLRNIPSPKTTTFRMYYDRGDLPFGQPLKKQLNREIILAWRTSPRELDYSHYLPIFFDGYVLNKYFDEHFDPFFIKTVDIDTCVKKRGQHYVIMKSLFTDKGTHLYKSEKNMRLF